MLAGQRYLAFDTRNVPSAQANNITAIRTLAPVPLTNFPAWLNTVVLRTLAKQPAARYPDAAALGAAPQARVAGMPSDEELPTVFLGVEPPTVLDVQPESLAVDAPTEQAAPNMPAERVPARSDAAQEAVSASLPTPVQVTEPAAESVPVWLED